MFKNFVFALGASVPNINDSKGFDVIIEPIMSIISIIMTVGLSIWFAFAAINIIKLTQKWRNAKTVEGRKEGKERVVNYIASMVISIALIITIWVVREPLINFINDWSTRV